MKKFFYIALAAMLAVGCTDKHDEEISPIAPEVEQPGTIRFTASVDATRTVLNQGVTTWEAEDGIGIFGYKDEAFTNLNIPYVTESAGSEVEFVAKDAENVVEYAPTYYAYYPYLENRPALKTLATGPNTDIETLYFAINGTQKQTLTDGKWVNNQTVYLYGSGDTGSEGNVALKFRNLFPVVEFGFKGSDEVSKIVVNFAAATPSATNFITGKGYFNGTTGELTATNTNSTTACTLTFTNGMELSETPSNIQMVAGRVVAEGGLKLTVTYANGATYVKTIWESLATDKVTLWDATNGAKHIYQVVQLPYILGVNLATNAFAAAGGSQSVTFKSSSAWSVTSTPDWISCDATSGAAGENITLTLIAESSTAAERTGEVVLTNDLGLTLTIPVSQEAYVATAAEYYSVSVADIDWGSSYVHYVLDSDSKKIAMLTKEYLGATVNLQAIVAYPMVGGVADLTKGVVVEVTVDGATGAAPSGAVHGGSVSFTAEAVTYTAGSAAAATALYVKADGSAIVTTEPSATYAAGTVQADVLTSDVKSHPVVKIGLQYWLAEDFKTTKYADGTAIGTTDSTTEGLLYIYADTHYLYNAFALGHGASGDSSFTDKISPEGWKLIVTEDWTELTTFVGGTFANYLASGANLSLYSGVNGGKYTYSSSSEKFTAAALAYPSTLGQYVDATAKKIGFYGIQATKFVNTTQAKTSCFTIRLIKE